MSVPERPRLVGAEAIPFQWQGQDYLRISSRDGLTREALVLPKTATLLLQLLDGTRTTEEIKRAFEQTYFAPLVEGQLEEVLTRLDNLYLLHNTRRENKLRDTIDEFRQATIREPSHAGGSYPSDPDQLRSLIDGMFASPGGPGLPRSSPKPNGRVGGILSPHIDFQRGGNSFAWGFRELVDHADADTFVILGTGHYTSERFTLTRKDFRTPLGILRNDRELTDLIARHYGDGVFEEEIAHRPEHSIEFQVLFLQHLVAARREIGFVPILVGSFHDTVEASREPVSQGEIRRMIEAIRESVSSLGRKVCYISSGDLAHIGMKFGDPWTIDESRRAQCERADRELLSGLESGQGNDLFRNINQENDIRRVCGFPPTYTMLEVLRPESGRLLQYDQYVDERGFEIVSFASMAFYTS
ncbi:hypothetical protein Pan216_38410 [Planctomycetes bacterium Pan216]|uniref:AmmeMemoRadiSam system protein B n=1 Tax=Kolteria novifilia TaxID=2527975 RepID=A0A518B7L6_9BACT|nr:hypothetical protein Pan216_38410 [Planctomycetes bacterium Pan216]